MAAKKKTTKKKAARKTFRRAARGADRKPRGRPRTDGEMYTMDAVASLFIDGTDRPSDKDLFTMPRWAREHYRDGITGMLEICEKVSLECRRPECQQAGDMLPVMRMELQRIDFYQSPFEAIQILVEEVSNALNALKGGGQ